MQEGGQNGGMRQAVRWVLDLFGLSMDLGELWMQLFGRTAVTTVAWLALQYLLVLPLVGQVLLALTLFFGVMTIWPAVRSRFREESITLDLKPDASELPRVKEPSPALEIKFNFREHSQQMGSVTLYRVEVMNTTAKTIPRVSVKLKNIEPIRTAAHALVRERVFKEQVSYLIDLPFILKHDRNDPPIKEFALDPGDGREVDIIQGTIPAKGSNPQQFYELCHAVGYWLGAGGAALQFKRDPNPLIDANRYRLTVVVHGQDTKPTEKSFIVDYDIMGELTFSPE